MTLWNSAKETARSRDHPSRGFRTPRNEDSQNLKPLSTPESAKTILSTSKAQELHPASWQAQKHIPCVYGSPHIPSLVRSLVLSGLVSCITLQPPSLLWSPFMQYVTSFSWSNLIGAPPTWRLEQKRNRPLEMVDPVYTAGKLKQRVFPDPVGWTTKVHVLAILSSLNDLELPVFESWETKALHKDSCKLSFFFSCNGNMNYVIRPRQLLT